jgi:hypothetical protein
MSKQFDLYLWNVMFVVRPSDGSLYVALGRHYELPPEGRATNVHPCQTRKRFCLAGWRVIHWPAIKFVIRINARAVSGNWA